MITMTTELVAVHGTRLRVDGGEQAYVPVWAKRRSVIVLGFSPNDNSTGVSAVERRHL